MADTWKVTCTSLHVRDQPSTAGKKITVLNNGDTVSVDQQQGSWVHHDKGGWSCATSASGKSYMVRVEVSQDTPAPPAEDTTEESAQIQKENLAAYQEIDLSPGGAEISGPSNLSGVTSNEDYLSNLEDSLTVSSCRGIIGMPYQFMPIVDTRISRGSDAFGRKFAEKIVSKMPILAIVPGKPRFMSEFSKKQKRSIIESIVGSVSGSKKSNIEEMLDSGGKFYTLEFDYEGYYKYVNQMCRAMAFFMGIEDTKVNGVKLKNFNWRGDIESDLSKVINYTKCVAFYIDSEKSISENFSNNTTESMLKQSINTLSDAGREIQYYLGNASAQTGIQFDKFTNQEDLAQNVQNVNDFIDSVLGAGNGNIFKRITGNIQTIASGGRLIFPDIWSDSSFSRSFNISQTLVSPDPDDLSIYLNILVPMAYWICLAAPRAATMPNGYISPYGIKAFYKGMFNVDMGMIEGLSFTKGEEGSWTRSGLPTVVKVSVDIKDLYSQFAMSNKNFGEMGFFNNTILLDYLANLCGININEIDVYRNVEMFAAMAGYNTIRDALRFTTFGAFEQWWSNKTHALYKKIFF